MFKGASDQYITEVFDGTPVILRFKWNARFEFWSVSIYDRQSNPLLMGVKLVRDFPLLGRLHLETVPGELVVSRLYGDWDDLRFDSLPEEAAVIWLSADEVEDLKNAAAEA